MKNWSVKHTCYLWCFLLLHPLLINAQTGSSSAPLILFDLLDTAKTSVKFVNRLTPSLSDNANLFDFDYFYNGAGVAIADFDRDGLQDIFFCGNQVPDKLYRNLGDFKFVDVTEQMNIQHIDGWSNGVSVADVNRDGWPDIYISRGGPKAGLSRQNLLWINHEGKYFTEEAVRYGLGDLGLSTQSAFFDFDKDGDLDCFVMNENDYYGLPPLDFYNTVGSDSAVFENASSHLYRNDEGSFVDISAQAGVLRPSFGLGICIADINEDGWMDIYMTNDYFIPDALFINQKDGTFRDEVKTRFKQMAFYGMGVDIADLDNDLDQDIFVLDMAFGDHYRSKKLMRSMNVSNFRLLVNTLQMPYQYMYNALQMNNGAGQFDNISHFSGVSKTGWSWAALLEDLDNDGKRDIYVTTGYRKYAMDNDFQRKVKEVQARYDGKVPLSEKQKLYEAMWSERYPNVLYHNEGDMHFLNLAAAWGLDATSFSNGAAIGDLDNDGLLDIVVNNIDHPAFVYRGRPSSKHWLNVVVQGDVSEHYSVVEVYANGLKQSAEIRRVRGYFSSSQPLAHFGLGDRTKVDSVIIRWKDGSNKTLYHVAANQVLSVSKPVRASYTDSVRVLHGKGDDALVKIDPLSIGLNYKHEENRYDDFAKEVLLPFKQSTLGPPLVAGDVNGDGYDDLIIGGAAGQPTQLFFNGTRGFNHFIPAAFMTDAYHEDGAFCLFDMDGDGDLDLFATSAGNAKPAGDSMYYDRLYENPGNGNFVQVPLEIPGDGTYSARAVVPMDIDKDGHQELVVGNRIVPQSYPKAPPSYVLATSEDGWTDRTVDLVPEFSQMGSINEMVVTDVNRDGWEDLIVVGEWGAPHIFINEHGVLRDRSGQWLPPALSGWWWSVSEVDINRDDMPDYILGNAGLNMKYKASEEHPFEVFAGDVDKNRTWDVILAHPEGDHIVPVRGKECSSQQMPFIKEKFKSYDAYASATLSDIYGKALDSTVSKQVKEFRSIVLVNRGGTHFEVLPLPWQAQLFPLLGVIPLHSSEEGMSYFLFGDEYNTEVETPRWDAGHGSILTSKNGRLSIKNKKGWALDGNVKDGVKIRLHDGSDLLIFTRNNEMLQCLRYK